MATATVSRFKNPFGEVDETTKKFQAAIGYNKATNPYEGLANPYGTAYQSGLADTIKAQTNQTLTGPEAVANARQNRSNMAGLGILSGTAYDTAQANTAADIMRQGANRTSEALGEARTKGAEWDANTAFQKAAFGSDEEKAANTFSNDLYLKAIGYNEENPTRLTTQLNAIKTAYPDITKAPLAEQQRYAEIYSALTGGAYSVAASPNDNMPGVSLPGVDTTVNKTERLAMATNLQSTMDKALDPAVYTMSQLKNWAQTAIDEGYITEEQLNAIVKQNMLNSGSFADMWQAKDNIRNAVLSAVRKGTAV